MMPALPSTQTLLDWAQAARPVFVVGPPRSGTSMLLLALARHSAFFELKGVFETFVFHRAEKPLAEPVPGMLRSYLGGEAGVAGLRAWFAAWRAAQPLAADDALLLFFYYAAHQVYWQPERGQRRVLEKTPAHANNLPAIFRVFPQARVLACAREPADILRSYRQRLAREQAQGKPAAAWQWLTVGERQLGQQLAKVEQAYEAARQAWPGQVFQVPYGWITAQPAQALAEIAEFLAEPFEAAMLEPKALPKRAPGNRLGLPIGASAVDAGSQEAPVQISEAALASLHAALPPGLAAAWQRVGH